MTSCFSYLRALNSPRTNFWALHSGRNSKLKTRSSTVKMDYSLYRRTEKIVVTVSPFSNFIKAISENATINEWKKCSSIVIYLLLKTKRYNHSTSELVNRIWEPVFFAIHYKGVRWTEMLGCRKNRNLSIAGFLSIFSWFVIQWYLSRFWLL